MILSLALLIILAISYEQWSSQREVHKLIMPGTYKLQLEAGQYSVWNFSRWPSKKISEQLKDIQINIKGPAPITLTSIVPKDKSPDYKRDGKIGRTDLKFEVKIAGLYVIQCGERCVLVILPSCLEYPATTFGDHWINFPGAEDDYNFDKPIQ